MQTTDPPANPQPDIRLRRTRGRWFWLKTTLALLLAMGVIVGMVFLVRHSEERKISDIVRKGMQDKVNVTVAELTLERVEQNAYSGIARTEDGEEWTVKVRITENRSIAWRARPPLERARRELRERLETSMKTKLKTFELDLDDRGKFKGLAVLTTGEEFDIEENPEESEMLYRIEWTKDFVDGWVKREAPEVLKEKVQSLTITRQNPGEYAGKLIDTNGLTYDVRIQPNNEADLPPDQRGASSRLVLEPTAENYPLWARRRVENRTRQKVADLTLTKVPDVPCYTGKAKLANGELWEVRVGLAPSAWPVAPRTPPGRLVCLVALAPESYQTASENYLHKHAKSKVYTLTFGKEKNGERVGRAWVDDGREYEVRFITRSPDSALPEGWPPLPPDVSWEHRLVKEP